MKTKSIIAAAVALAFARLAHGDATLVPLTGAIPVSPGLAVDSSGNVFGATGYADQGGTVFELSGSNHQTMTTLVTGVGGPYFGLVADPSGNLYGMQQLDFASNVGTVFEVSGPSHQTLTTVATVFNNSTGTFFGSLSMDSAGNLYGATNTSIFKLSGTNHQTLTSTSLYNFGYTGGGFSFDSAGNFYGVTFHNSSGGSGQWYVGSTTLASQPTFISVNFSPSVGEYTPQAGLVMDSAGDLYGTVEEQGSTLTELVYELSGPGHQTFTPLYSYPAGNESNEGSLAIDAQGNIFGETQAAGAYGDGSIFELSGSNHQTVTTVASFNSGSSYFHPTGTLTPDAAGNLFGTAMNNTSQSGEVFELSNSGYVTQFVHFNASTGTGIQVRSVPGLALQAGGKAVVDPAAMDTNRQLLVITSPGLSLAGTTGAWTAQVDLANNDMDLPGASLAIVTDQVRQGYANGTWNGTSGITSSTAAADTTHLTALGVIQNNQLGTPLFSSNRPFDTFSPGASDILIKYTYYGDANLDGVVDGSDYSLIDNGFIHSLTGWANGDFNYDGVVNGSDYTLIDNAFSTQGAALTATPAGSTAQIASTAVPEPALSLLAFAGISMLRRRRHSAWTIRQHWRFPRPAYRYESHPHPSARR